MESVRIASHTCFPAGMQALEYLKNIRGFTAVPIGGDDPCAPSECRLLIKGTRDSYPDPYAYAQDLTKPPPDDHSANRLRIITQNMPWTMRASTLIFVNPRYLKVDDAFPESHLEAYYARLLELLRT